MSADQFWPNPQGAALGLACVFVIVIGLWLFAKLWK